jgi:hypothetical protein
MLSLSPILCNDDISTSLLSKWEELFYVVELLKFKPVVVTQEITSKVKQTRIMT